MGPDCHVTCTGKGDGWRDQRTNKACICHNLVLKRYPGRKPSKLHAPWRGPYAVVRGEPGGVHVVQDLATLKTFDVHVEFLKKFHVVDGVEPADIAAMDTGEDVVQEIVDSSIPSKKAADWEFRVRWAGYGPEDDTWEGWQNVRGLAALDAYLELNPQLGKMSPKLRSQRGL